MGSIEAVEIAADLEGWLGRPLSPTTIYNYLTIAVLAQFLARPPAASAPTGNPPTLCPFENVDPDLLRREVQQMTEEEMEAFLSQAKAAYTPGSVEFSSVKSESSSLSGNVWLERRPSE
jgi:hypothetical protein